MIGPNNARFITGTSIEAYRQQAGSPRQARQGDPHIETARIDLNPKSTEFEAAFHKAPIRNA